MALIKGNVDETLGSFLQCWLQPSMDHWILGIYGSPIALTILKKAGQSLQYWLGKSRSIKSQGKVYTFV